MKNLQLLIIATFILTSTIFYAQSAGNLTGDSGYQKFTVIKMISEKNSKEIGIKGNPYLSSNFKTGKILYQNKKTENTYQLKYNAHKDVIEILTNEAQNDAVLTSGDISVLIGNDLYVYTKFIDKKGKTRTGYLRVLYSNNKITLYKRESKVYYPGKTSPNPLIPSTPGRFKDFKEIYLQKGKNTITYIKKMKILLSEINSKGKRKEIKKIIKKNKLKFKNEEDLKKIAALIN